ncbi:E3 ubiquitin-protein ligase TRIM7-like isoform X2 [Sceloporus undulatus]|uniref:E3 ubiquitin-protein ligase TRIM7-like isoform X2 n=1 Tax=Sceloporus undulatus TaxID=8520 RepID=UPI001C4B3A9D|nr:E3 ubiquitin-protein ligase TRIM7-like isoform X2 [Sceloporus undulatus]
MEGPVSLLQKEASCSICLELFREPVSIPCGHSFCQACISHCWKEEGPFACPQCRQQAPRRDFRPNRELGNVADLARSLGSLLLLRGGGGGGEKEDGGEGRSAAAAAAPAAPRGLCCPRHLEALKLFCGREEQLICCICRESRAHRSHDVFPLEEAAQDYRKDIQTRLQSLKEERETLLGLKLAGELKHQEFLRQTEAEREKATSEFAQIHHFLEEQEKLLLAQLNELEKEIVKHQKEHSTTFSDEILSLTAVITEVEEKCEQPDSEFLQDIRNTLSRFDKDPFQPPKEMPCKIEKRLNEFSEKNNALTEIIKNFKDTLPSKLGTEWGTPGDIYSNQPGLHWQLSPGGHFQRLPRPRLWNDLLREIRQLNMLSEFKTVLKTFLFWQAYPVDFKL